MPADPLLPDPPLHGCFEITDLITGDSRGTYPTMHAAVEIPGGTGFYVLTQEAFQAKMVRVLLTPGEVAVSESHLYVQMTQAAFDTLVKDGVLALS